MLWVWWKVLFTERNPGRRTFTHTEQRFAARAVWRPGPELFKPCWIDCGEATTINGLALKSFDIYWKGA